MEQIFWYLLASTRGGPNRLRILDILHDTPSNAQQLSEVLQLNYRTVRHHLSVLLRNGLIVQPAGDAYASPFFLSGVTVENWELVLQLKRRSGGGHSPAPTVTYATLRPQEQRTRNPAGGA